MLLLFLRRYSSPCKITSDPMTAGKNPRNFKKKGNKKKL
jgi:hypothetical protein